MQLFIFSKIVEMVIQQTTNLILLITFVRLKFIQPRSTSGHQCKIVDLTHDFSYGSTQYWDAMEKFKMSTVFNGTVKPAGYHYEAYKFDTAEHGGTHLDAPSHFSENGSSIDRVDLAKLMGPACVIDVSNKSARNIDYRLDVSDLLDWEKVNGPIPQSCIILMRTDRDKLYYDRSKYFGSSSPADEKTYHFPGLALEAAEWLIAQNKMRMFGLDTPSLDYGQSRDFIIHRTLNGHEISGIENLANLDKLPPKGATVIALPVKNKGGSGGPVRVIAMMGCGKLLDV